MTSLQNPTDGLLPRLGSAPSTASPAAPPSATAASPLSSRRKRLSYRAHSRSQRHKDAALIPATQQFARISGSVDFACPHCTRLLSARRVNAHDASVRCHNAPICQRKWLIGIYLHPIVITRAPGFFAYLAHAPAPARVRNPLTAVGMTPHLGRIMGVVEWQCSKGHITRGYPDFTEGIVACDQCNEMRSAFLVLYPTTKAKPHGTPLDWTPPQRRTIS